MKSKKGSNNNLKRMVAREVKKITPKPELKYHDAHNTAILDVNGQFLQPLSHLPTGTTDISRIGDEINLSRLRIEMNLNYESQGGLTDAEGCYRVILFQWLDNDGVTVPVPNDILNSALTSNLQIAPFKYDRIGTLFNVIHDKVYSFPWHGNTGLCDTYKKLVFDLYKDKKTKKQIRYVNGAITGYNQLYLMIIASRSFDVTTTNAMNCAVYSRLTFTD